MRTRVFESPNLNLQSRCEHDPSSANEKLFFFLVQPDIPWLLAKVEEIKRLQCEISMNSNAALTLCMEVIVAIDHLQLVNEESSEIALTRI